MEHTKKYIKLSMKMLSEAERYSTEYIECKESDIEMADVYKTLAQIHLDAYNKIKPTVQMHLNKVRREDPKSLIGDMYSLVHDVEEDLYMGIQDKLRK